RIDSRRGVRSGAGNKDLGLRGRYKAGGKVSEPLLLSKRPDKSPTNNTAASISSDAASWERAQDSKRVKAKSIGWPDGYSRRIHAGGAAPPGVSVVRAN